MPIRSCRTNSLWCRARRSSVPPDFSLRPPRIGEQRPQEVPAVEQARETVFRIGNNQADKLPPAADQRSPGESELLREAGAAKAPADIRQLVDTEAASANQMSDSFVDKLAFWRKDDKPGSPDQVIDPSAEAERLAALRRGAPPAGTAATATTATTAAATPAPAGLTAKPTIERTPTESTSIPGFSWLGNLF